MERYKPLSAFYKERYDKKLSELQHEKLKESCVRY